MCTSVCWKTRMPIWRCSGHEVLTLRFGSLPVAHTHLKPHVQGINGYWINPLYPTTEAHNRGGGHTYAALDRVMPSVVLVWLQRFETRECVVWGVPTPVVNMLWSPCRCYYSVRACANVCVRVSVCVWVRACVRVSVCAWVCVRMCVWYRERDSG